MKMKMITFALLGLGLMSVWPAEADAAVCARGVYRAGCAGPRGAVVTHRAPVAAHCHYRAGVRVCR